MQSNQIPEKEGKHTLQDRAVRVEAENEFAGLTANPLFIAGLMLYWGEGDKADNALVSLANTEPHLCRVFVEFLICICHIPLAGIRVNLLLRPDLNKDMCIEYWASNLGLPRTNFAKCTDTKGKSYHKKSEYGICMVYFSSRYFKKKILVWLNLLPGTLISKETCENI